MAAVVNRESEWMAVPKGSRECELAWAEKQPPSRPEFRGDYPSGLGLPRKKKPWEIDTRQHSLATSSEPTQEVKGSDPLSDPNLADGLRLAQPHDRVAKSSERGRRRPARDVHHGRTRQSGDNVPGIRPIGE
jgi:hypothetical protein